MISQLIPLFPLNLVLFPGQALPLHIFEPRYRIMTRLCAERDSPFGMVLAQDQSLAQVGCSTLIVRTLKEYEDGRSDILTVGQSAFRLLRTHNDKPYMEADVEYLEEDLDGVDAALSARLEGLFDQCHQILYDEDAPKFDPTGDISLAHFVASELPLELTFRQDLLELRSEAERQRQLAERLKQWYPQLQKRDQMRGKASGNGHGSL